MVWYLLAALTAICHAGYNLVSKKAISKADVYIVGAVSATAAALISTAVLLATGFPALGPDFWKVVPVEIALESLSLLLYLKALEKADISLAVPFLALTPAFLLLTSPLITGENISFQGAVGVLISAGSIYFLARDSKQKGWLKPFERIASNEGMRLMLAVAVLHSLTANFYKLLVVNSSAPLTSVIIEASTAAIFWALVAAKRSPVRKAGGIAPQAAVCGAFSSIGGIALGLALTTGLTPFVITIRRLSIPLTVLLGHHVLKEEDFRQRIIASAVLLVGAALILLS